MRQDTLSPSESKPAETQTQIARDLSRLREELAAAETREAELVAAVERANAVVAGKGEFLAHMSHELRSPMTAVIGMSELLMETTLSGEQRDMVSTVRRSAGALVTLVNDILDFSKIESGKMQVEHRRFNLRECIEECLDLMAPNVRDKPVELLYHMGPETPEIVVGDGNRVRQVLVNLLSNAVKFTSDGEIVVSINADCLDESYSQIHIGVRDSGIGIPQDKLPTLFGDYVQAEASTARQYGGTGLGLSISRGLAELMKGGMWVESESGIGSTFHFTFACEVCNDSAGPTNQEAGLEGRRLLVVEANKTSRGLLVRQASEWGMDVVATGDPAVAISHIGDDSRFDVVVLDRRVRDMDGGNLGGNLQKNARNLPIVLLTSLAGSANLTAQSGATMAPVIYVSRPIKPKRLQSALSSAINCKTNDNQRKAVAAPKLVDRRLGEKLNISILLADDEPMIQKVARKFLSKMGFEAEIVSNGQELLDALHRKSFDVVLVDFNMPVMGGLEAASRIREEFTAETAPYLVAMTGVVLDDDDGVCFANGIDDVLPKPWGASELQKTLEDAASIIQWRRDRMLVAS